MSKSEPENSVIEQMAADLIRFQIVDASERDAIRALMSRYRYGEVVVFLDDARAIARARGKGAGA